LSQITSPQYQLIELASASLFDMIYPYTRWSSEICQISAGSVVDEFAKPADFLQISGPLCQNSTGFGKRLAQDVDSAGAEFPTRAKL
jgi:hypothetical protein